MISLTKEELNILLNEVERDANTLEARNVVVLLRKRISNLLSVPQPLEDSEIDLSSLKRTCVDHVNAINEQGEDNDDVEHYIYEEAMTTIFGPDIFTWINKKTS